MKRILVVGFSLVVLVGAAGTGYMMIAQSEQKRAQCQQELQNMSLKEAHNSTQYAQQLAQLKAENKTLQEKNEQLMAKAASTLQLQQTVEQLKMQNQALQKANQALKQNSNKKIEALSTDLQKIQKDQKKLKAQYKSKPKPKLKSKPKSKSVAPAVKRSAKHAPAATQDKQPDNIQQQSIQQVPAPDQPTSGDNGLSLDFPAPPSSKGSN